MRKVFISDMDTEYKFQIELLEANPSENALVLKINGRDYLIIGEFPQSTLYNALKKMGEEIIKKYHPTGIEIRLRDVQIPQD